MKHWCRAPRKRILGLDSKSCHLQLIDDGEREFGDDYVYGRLSRPDGWNLSRTPERLRNERLRALKTARDTARIPCTDGWRDHEAVSRSGALGAKRVRDSHRKS